MRGAGAGAAGVVGADGWTGAWLSSVIGSRTAPPLVPIPAPPPSPPGPVLMLVPVLALALALAAGEVEVGITAALGELLAWWGWVAGTAAAGAL